MTLAREQENRTAYVQSFRDLLVWQKAIQLAALVYRLTRDFPAEELYGLTSQIRRSAVSVASNIAEGQGRLTTGEFRHFLGMARGSNCEVQTHLELARVLHLGNPGLIEQAEALTHEVGKMLYSVIHALKE